MATPYSNIYSRFLNKVTDYSFLNQTTEEMENGFKGWMDSAIVHFRRCKKDLFNADNTLEQFNEDLTPEEQEIIALLMIVEYLSPKLITADLLKQTVNSKDFKLYSQANHIKEIRELRNMIKKDASQMMMEYSYQQNNMDHFK